MVEDDFETLSEKLARVTIECERLRQENSRLRELLNQRLPFPKNLLSSPRKTVRKLGEAPLIDRRSPPRQLRDHA